MKSLIRKLLFVFGILGIMFFSSCDDVARNNELNAVSEKDLDASLISVLTRNNIQGTKKLRIVSFNMHGQTSDLPKFLGMLNGESIVCLQEVNDYEKVRKIMSEFPYMCKATNKTTGTGWGNSKPPTNIMICSKVPFASSHSKLIQIDPGGDKWERHAQHVEIKINAGEIIDLFNYHNTYNWGKKYHYSEKEGLRKFKRYIEDRIGTTIASTSKNLFLAGDFNLREHDVRNILGSIHITSSGIDYICSRERIKKIGVYKTIQAGLSDHNAIWGEWNFMVTPSEVVGRKVTIFNTHQKEYLYAADYAPYDKDRRRVFTWRPGKSVKQGIWRLEPEGDNIYRIFNTYQKEYLYAGDYAPYDKDRRRVFTWRPGGPVKQGIWRLEPEGNNIYRIFNTYQKEYLYAGDYAPYDKDRRRVFTWRPGWPVKQGIWRLEPSNN